MKSLNHLSKTPVCYSYLGRFPRADFISRTYKNFQHFLSEAKKCHTSLDTQGVVTIMEDIVQCNSKNKLFNFEPNYGRYISDTDVVIASCVSAMNPVMPWNHPFFSIKTLVNNSSVFKRSFDPYLFRDSQFFERRICVTQKTSTLQEISCASIIPRTQNVTTVDFNRNKAMVPFSHKNLTSNKFPDYACAVVFDGNKKFEYFGDLKITSFRVFEKKVLGLHPNTNFDANFYLVADLSPKYVFSPAMRAELERHYYSVCAVHLNSKDPVSHELVWHSQQFFAEFQSKGTVEAYNSLPLNTAKITTMEDIKNYIF